MNWKNSLGWTLSTGLRFLPFVIMLVPFAHMVWHRALVIPQGIGLIASCLPIGVILLFVNAHGDERARQSKREAELAVAQKNLQTHPTETTYAWEVASKKLEGYLDRNLSHVSAIFWLTIVVMMVGFVLVVVGVFFLYQNPEKELMATVAGIGGIVTEVIGASFMLVYRSVMSQAQSYVQVLERINAVGMSIQVLDSGVGGDTSERNKARVQLASDLLRMFTPQSRSTDR